MTAEVVFSSPESGGRQFMPVGSGYAPYLRCLPSGEDMAVRLHEVPPEVRHGDPFLVTIEIMYEPRIPYAGIEPGSRFDLVEGQRIVASGVCTKLQPAK